MVRATKKLPAKDWLPFFREAAIRVDELNDIKSERSKSIKLGQFLSPNVGRRVPIQVDGRTGYAVLCVELERARSKVYFLKVTWDDSSADDQKPVQKSGETTAKGKAKKPVNPPPIDERPNQKRGEKKGKAKSKKANSSSQPQHDRKKAKPSKRGGSQGNSEKWS